MRAIPAWVVITLLLQGCDGGTLDPRTEAEAVRMIAGCYELRYSNPSRWWPTSWLSLDTTRIGIELTRDRDSMAYEPYAYQLRVPSARPIAGTVTSFWRPTGRDALRTVRFMTDAGNVLHLRRRTSGRLEGFGWSEGMVEQQGARFRAQADPVPCTEWPRGNEPQETHPESNARPPHN